MAKLQTTQIASLVNAAYSIATGSADISTLALEDFCDGGTAALESRGLRDKFTGALIGQMAKNWFIDSSYRSQLNDPWFTEESEYGAIIQMISVTAPQVHDAENWQDFTDGDTIGTYTLHLPSVSTKYFTYQDAYQLDVAIQSGQLNQAFKNASELAAFINYIYMVVDNALIAHTEDMQMLNVCSFMAHKINYTKGLNPTGIHKVNLIKAYCDETGTSSMTADAALNDADFLRWACGEIDRYNRLFKRQTSLFNTDGAVRFTPDDRKVFQLLSYFRTRLETTAYSTTYRDEWVKLPKYQEVDFWQGTGDDLSFNSVSSIDVSIDGSISGHETSSGTPEEITQTGIVGLIADMWAAPHCIKSRRTPTKYFEFEDITRVAHQCVDMYLNNLSVNAIIFTLEDVAEGIVGA